jgi:hypothetical protein
VRSHLSILIEAERSRAGLSEQALVEKLGYKNRTKGLRRLATLEKEGEGPPEFFCAVVRELNITSEQIQAAQAKDAKEEDRAFEESLSTTAHEVYCQGTDPCSNSTATQLHHSRTGHPACSKLCRGQEDQSVFGA